MLRHLTCVILLSSIGTIALAGEPATQPDEESWRKVKAIDGRVKSKPQFFKFQPTSANWRIKLDTAIKGEPTASNIRVAVMIETARDVDDSAVSWQQVAELMFGKPGEKSIEKSFDNGLDKNGEPKWFQLVISGHNATFDILIEDQSETKSKKKRSD
jgi:hypothetical protein